MFSAHLYAVYLDEFFVRLSSNRAGCVVENAVCFCNLLSFELWEWEGFFQGR